MNTFVRLLVLVALVGVSIAPALAQDPTAPGDHLFFEFTGGDEAAFGP